MSAEFQGGSIFGKGKQVHAEKIYCEFTIDVVQLILIFSVVFVQVLFINLFKVMEIVWALGIHTFVNDKVFTLLFGNKGIVAVWTAELYRRKTTVSGGKTSVTDFAQKLSF